MGSTGLSRGFRPFGHDGSRPRPRSSQRGDVDGPDQAVGGDPESYAAPPGGSRAARRAHRPLGAAGAGGAEGFELLRPRLYASNWRRSSGGGDDFNPSDSPLRVS